MDILTIAYASKAATKCPEWETQSTWYGEGEIELMYELCDAAGALDEMAIKDLPEGAFEHLTFCYEIAEPFGRLFVEYKHKHPSDRMPEDVIRAFLNENVFSPEAMSVGGDRVSMQ